MGTLSKLATNVWLKERSNEIRIIQERINTKELCHFNEAYVCELSNLDHLPDRREANA